MIFAQTFIFGPNTTYAHILRIVFRQNWLLLCRLEPADRNAGWRVYPLRLKETGPELGLTYFDETRVSSWLHSAVHCRFLASLSNERHAFAAIFRMRPAGTVTTILRWNHFQKCFFIKSLHWFLISTGFLSRWVNHIQSFECTNRSRVELWKMHYAAFLIRPSPRTYSPKFLYRAGWTGVDDRQPSFRLRDQRGSLYGIPHFEGTHFGLLSKTQVFKANNLLKWIVSFWPLVLLWAAGFTLRCDVHRLLLSQFAAVWRS